MLKRVITDNLAERITVKWDGDIFILERKNITEELPAVIFLSYREMEELIEFVDEEVWHQTSKEKK